MSGHSHWSGIKHKKGANDAKRGKIFSKLAMHIMVAARSAGSDPTMNLPLRYAIDKARAANMPKSNIDRAIKKGAGELPGQQLVEITYEGYGPGGVAVLVDVLTDNRNRTAGEIRKIFEVRGGNLGESNSVAWMFSGKGLILVEKTPGLDEDALMEIVLDAGADEITEQDETFEILCSPNDFEAVKNAVEAGNLTIQAAELTKISQNTLKLDGKTTQKALALLEALDDQDDAQNISSNLEIDESILLEEA